MWIKTLYTSFLWLCMMSVAGGNGVRYEYVCDYCVEYNPPHWKEDGFEPITMIRIA